MVMRVNPDEQEIPVALLSSCDEHGPCSSHHMMTVYLVVNCKSTYRQIPQDANAEV
jgi:hypothetical protein